jgi:hypothetical protein
MSELQKIEVEMAKTADLNSLADCGSFAPGYMSYIVRAVAAVINNDVAAAGVLKFDKRPTAGSDVSRGDGDVAILNLSTLHTGGKVVYKDGLNIRLDPGQEIVAEVTDVTGASDTARVILYLEPTWERPANNTAMVATA